MNAAKQTPVRIGNQPARNNRMLLIGGGVALVVVVLVVVIVAATSGSEEGEADAQEEGCRSDADCQPGSLCAAGGCLILGPTATPLVWREDIRAQFDPDAGARWQPRSTFGEKLLVADNCPAPLGQVDEPELRATVPVVKATVYEVQPDKLVVHKHARVKADIWIDGHRFWFPEVPKLDPGQICTASEVAKIAVGKGRFQGRPSPYVDAAFTRAAPAGVVASAAVSVTTALPTADAEGVRTLAFRLYPVLALDARYHSVITFPLGSDVLAIEGPPPSMQRLFRGHLAYYWEHTKIISDLNVRFRPAAGVRERLDYAGLNP
jgi:hypothetical protein